MAGWAPVQVRREANPSPRPRAAIKRTLSREPCSTEPVGKALGPDEDQGDLSMEEVPEAVGGALRRNSREDVSFVVPVSRAGMAFRRKGEGGAGGGKNLFQLQNWLGSIARNANRGRFCNKECFHHLLKVSMSIIKIRRGISGPE